MKPYSLRTTLIPIPNYEDCYAIAEDGSVTRLETGKVLKPCLNKQNGYLYVSLWKNNKGKAFAVHRLVANAYLPNPDNKPEVNHISSNRADPRKENLEWSTRGENVKHGYEDGFMSQEHRRNFLNLEMEMLLQAFLAGESMTSLALGMEVGLSRLTINLRTTARNSGLEEELDTELRRQKKARNASASASKRQPILQFTQEGVFIAEYESISEAATSLGNKASGSISNALVNRNGQKYAYGYLWKYK